MQRRELEVVAAPESAPPFVADAVVAEEDTYLVLSADPEVRETRIARLRVIHEAFAARPAEPGSVVVRGGSPLRLLAVVHDLSHEPTWREEWVEAALDAVLREVDARSLRTLAMPLLGRVRGDLPIDWFVALLRSALGRCAPARLERVWLVTPEGDLEEVRALLKSGLFR
jgi:hypothetical protein